MAETANESTRGRAWWQFPNVLIRAMFERIRWLFPWRALATAAIVVLLLHAFGVIQLPFRPFTTRGTIYVDSPEVYTRERLVNDRYDQDWWLRRQLESLDQLDPRSLVQRHVEQDVRAQSGAGSDGDSGGAGTDRDTAAIPGLTFEQRFRVVSGVRDMIRQRLLENMLDDRHDLAGNSIYALKFDTTVIPGANTRDRAYVEITLQLDDLFASAPFGDTPPHVHASFLGKCRGDPTFDCKAAPDEPDPEEVLRRFAAQAAHYSAWLDDLSKRLNQAEDEAVAMLDRCPPEQDAAAGVQYFDALTRYALREVLGIPGELYAKHNPPLADDQLPGSSWSRIIRLPDPWAKYMLVSRGRAQTAGGNTPCGYRVWFEVLDLTESFTVARADADRGTLIPIQGIWIGDELYELRVDKLGWELRRGWFAEPIRPKYFGDGLTSLIGLFVRAGASNSPAQRLTVHSGLLNFIEGLGAVDAYAYAIFPKNDVVGVLAESRSRFAGVLADAGAIGFARRLAESRTDSVLLGFADGRPGEVDAAVRFGWVVSGLGAMAPVTKSQLALVSVPAWTDHFELKIRTGWIDRHGRPVTAQTESAPMTVRVPPDVTAFDAIFRGDDWFTRRPRIHASGLDERIVVAAGKEAEILIPGSRLWRSATVTLGSQSAERIRVLPNMEGIIAKFASVALPQGAQQWGDDTHCRTDSTTSARSVPLRVWTSEGVTEPLPVCVLFDAGGVPEPGINDEGGPNDIGAGAGAPVPP